MQIFFRAKFRWPEQHHHRSLHVFLTRLSTFAVMKILLDQFADYGRWANERFVVRLKQLPEALLDSPVPNSFPSLRATLLHIRDAEHAWWCRLNNLPTRWPAQPETEIDTLIHHTEQLRMFVHEQQPGDLLREHTYTDLRGNAYTQPAWQMIMHCLNHSTQHRGQLITMMRSLGLSDIPANDLVVYQRFSSKLL